jgi:hypothetical protein
MNTPLLIEGSSKSNPSVSRKVTRRNLRERAVELAVISGRAPQDATKDDWEQAKLELSPQPGG